MSTDEAPFSFLDPGVPADDAIELVLQERVLAETEGGSVPLYKFSIRRRTDAVEIGTTRR